MKAAPTEHTLLSVLSWTCIFSLNTLLEIKQENESVTLLFAKGQPVHENKTGEKNQEVKGQEEAKLSALA